MHSSNIENGYETSFCNMKTRLSWYCGKRIGLAVIQIWVQILLPSCVNLGKLHLQPPFFLYLKWGKWYLLHQNLKT